MLGAMGSESSAVVDLLRRHGEATTQFLRGALDRGRAEAPARLVEAMEYSLFAGGKRLRPALVLETARACGGGETPGQSALAAAGAVELVHTFSLVHDDLPAMDDDDLRRGRPTNHKVFGEAMAILAGDALFALAFHILSEKADPTVAPQLTLELARASGYVGMIGGQVLDMEGESQHFSLEQLRHLHRMKTGALLVASCRMGAIASGAGTEGLTIDAVTTYGRHLGLAFQIVDDILDVTSTPEQLGKGTGKDAGRGKNTYPAILGLEKSRAEARRHLVAAVGAVAGLGERAEGMQKLASFVVERQV